MKVEEKTTLVMALFAGALLMLLALKFMLPTEIRVIIEGQSTYVQVVPSVYTTLDCVIIAIFSFLLGASTFYLLSIRFRTPEKERIEQEAEQKEAGSELALEVQDADTQVPETSKSSAGVTSEDEAGLLKILKGNEKRVIEALMEYGEMNQADLSARTGILSQYFASSRSNSIFSSIDSLSSFFSFLSVSYTHLTLPTICSV